jgi:hypothetical protein
VVAGCRESFGLHGKKVKREGHIRLKKIPKLSKRGIRSTARPRLRSRVVATSNFAFYRPTSTSHYENVLRTGDG